MRSAISTLASDGKRIVAAGIDGDGECRHLCAVQRGRIVGAMGEGCA